MSKPPAGGSARRGPVIAIIIAAVVGAALVAVAFSGGKKKSVAGEVNPVAVTGTALAKYDSTLATDPAVGTKPPELAGKQFDGSALSIVPGGKAKLVTFVAHWCPHCQREVPLIVSWLPTKPSTLDVLAVSTAVDPSAANYPPSTWLTKVKYTVPTLTDDAKSSAAAAWGLPGYPYLVLLKADGTVAARYSGEMALADLDAWVKKGLGLS